MPSPSKSATPWYRERWPWLLIAGPAIVVVAALVTAWVAVRSDDGLVAQDYYKRGLLVNKDLQRSDRAAALELGASLRIGADGGIEVLLSAAGDSPRLPTEIEVRFASAARGGQDVAAALARTGGGRYVGRVAPLPPGRWRVALEAGDWRLASGDSTPLPGEIRLGSARGAE